MADTNTLLGAIAVGGIGLLALRGGGGGDELGGVPDLRERLEQLREDVPSEAGQAQEALNQWRGSAAWDEFVEAFQGDRSSPGGLLSPIDESVMGGGNPTEVVEAIESTSDSGGEDFATDGGTDVGTSFSPDVAGSFSADFGSGGGLISGGGLGGISP